MDLWIFIVIEGTVSDFGAECRCSLIIYMSDAAMEILLDHSSGRQKYWNYAGPTPDFCGASALFILLGGYTVFCRCHTTTNWCGLCHNTIHNTGSERTAATDNVTVATAWVH
jgi:hypothetical protein